MPHLMNCEHSGEGWCLDCVKSLADENERINDFLAQPEELRIEYLKDKGVHTHIKHWAVKALVLSLADTIGDAPNFVTMEVGPTENGDILEVTIQRKSGKSTAQVLGELKARIAELEKEKA